MTARRNTFLPIWALRVTMMVGFGAAALACSDHHGISSDTCRFHPEKCNGGAGALCGDDGDCAQGLHCCDDNNNCGGGMCTADCKDDRDCPYDMLCEHDMCFYACDGDEDCASTMSCEHDNTICEYN